MQDSPTASRTPHHCDALGLAGGQIHFLPGVLSISQGQGRLTPAVDAQRRERGPGLMDEQQGFVKSHVERRRTVAGIGKTPRLLHGTASCNSGTLLTHTSATLS